MKPAVPRFLPALMLALSTCTSWAQAPAPAPGNAPGGGPGTQVQGKVQSFNAPVLIIVGDDGQASSFSLPPDIRIQVSVKRSLADIKPGDFVGSAAMLGDDGKRYAEEVHYIPEAMRAQVEGHRQMGTDVNRSMTNATVSQVVRNSGAQGGDELRLQYSGGEKTIVVRPGTPIVAMEAGDAGMLQPGVPVTVTTNRDAQGNISVRGVRIVK